ncbi:hypothetical protein ACLHXI_23700, partial [Escherichia coli]
VCGKKIGPDPRNFNQRVSLGRNDLLIRTFPNQRMTGSNARWKWTTDYNRRSIAETAMYRVKQLFGGSLTLRDYDGQVAEAMALVRALNKMTKAGMPESVRIA